MAAGGLLIGDVVGLSATFPLVASARCRIFLRLRMNCVRDTRPVQCLLGDRSDLVGECSGLSCHMTSIGSSCCRISEIAENGRPAPKGPRRISPGQSAGAGLGYRRTCLQSPDRARQIDAAIVPSFQGLFPTWDFGPLSGQPENPGCTPKTACRGFTIGKSIVGRDTM